MLTVDFIGASSQLAFFKDGNSQTRRRQRQVLALGEHARPSLADADLRDAHQGI